MKFNFNNQLNPMPKVAVTLAGKTRDEIRTKSLRLLEHHVDLIEWRADALSDDAKNNRDRFDISLLKEILDDFDGISVPVIFALRSSNEGGFFDETSRYDEILDEIISYGKIDYIDIEFETSKNFEDLVQKAHENGIDVIGTYHNHKETPEDRVLLNKMSEIEDKGADVVLVACNPCISYAILSYLIIIL
jgi:3-dehydroquinate dehydratase-1